MCLAPRLSPDRQLIGPQIIEALRGQNLKDPPCRGSQCCSVLVSRMGFRIGLFALAVIGRRMVVCRGGCPVRNAAH